MDLGSVAVAATPLWEQLVVAVGGGLAGGLVGGLLALLAASRSLDKSTRQSEVERKAQWEHAVAVHTDERAEARDAALLALLWELEINQKLLEQAPSMETPPLLAHRALDGASPWFWSLPDSTRGAVHDAQLHLVRYNVDAEHLRLALSAPASASQEARVVEAQKQVGYEIPKAIPAITKLRDELLTALM